jgi:hypothetical protein
MRRHQFNFGLDRRELEILARLGEEEGLRKTDIVRMLIRHEAKRRGWALQGGDVPGIVGGLDDLAKRIRENTKEDPC